MTAAPTRAAGQMSCKGFPGKSRLTLSKTPPDLRRNPLMPSFTSRIAANLYSGCCG